MEFTADDCLVLQTICDYFHTEAKWPTYDYVDKALSDDHEDLDVGAIARKLEPFMYHGAGVYTSMTWWDPKRQTFLSISALHTCLTEGICPDLGEDFDALMQVIKVCVEKYRARAHDDPQSAQVTSQEVHERFGLSDLMLRKVFDLASRAGLTYGSSGPDTTPGQLVKWSFAVSPDVRAYYKATTIEDFLRMRENAHQEAQRASQPYVLQTIVNTPDNNFALPVADTALNATTAVQLQPISLFPAGPFTRNEHLCFVLMPFAPEMQVVYDDAIAPAATRVGLECQRADEIMKPGGIMAQVWQALMEARVVVADLLTST